MQSACGPACIPRGPSGAEIAVDAVADGSQFLVRVAPRVIAFAQLSGNAKKI